MRKISIFSLRIPFFHPDSNSDPRSNLTNMNTYFLLTFSKGLEFLQQTLFF